MLPKPSRLPVTLAAAALVALTAACAQPTQRFADPIGDVAGGPAPDITSVTVGHEVDGSITFTVEFAETPPLSWSEADGYTDTLMILIDANDSPASIENADYVIGVHAVTSDQATFRRLRDGSGELSPATAAVAVVGRTVRLAVPLSAIGNPGTPWFWVGVGREGREPAAGGGSDSFPAAGMQPYPLGAPAWPPMIALVIVPATALVLVGVASAILLRAARRRVADAGGAAPQSAGPGER